MSDEGGRPELGISVIGPFRVLARDGENLTPPGRKARALLAILALTPARRRSRPALQDKLWSDRGPNQGAASLRQTLTEIRRVFGERYRDCLVSDMRGIGFAEGRVTIDLDDTDLSELARSVELPVLLEDIDIADAEFEDWVRNQRAVFEQRVVASRATIATHSVIPPPELQFALKPKPKPKPKPKSIAAPRNAASVVRPWVRLLSPLTVSDESGLFLSRLIGTRIVQELADQWAIDFRDDGVGTQGVQLRVDALVISGDVVVNIVLLAADGSIQLWSGFETTPLGKGFVSDAPRLQALVNRAVAAASHYLRRMESSPDGSRAFTQAFDAVQRMFKIDLDEVDRADTLLHDAYELDPKASYLAWRAYARTFYIGEYMLSDRRTAVGEIEELARRALEADPHNATVLALTSYVYSFALRKYAMGHELAELSIKSNPAHPLGHAFLGRVKSYLGDHDGGYSAACRGRELSGYTPYRYKLHFLCGVTALLSGRFDAAVREAEIACTMAPAYRPPQRYVIPLYLKLGKRDKAQDAFEKLRRIEPSFSLDAMREISYPSTAVREAGLLRFSNRDL